MLKRLNVYMRIDVSNDLLSNCSIHEMLSQAVTRQVSKGSYESVET